MATNTLQAPEGVVECDKPTNKQFKDLTGQQYGRLTVVEYFGKRPYVVKSGKNAGQTLYRHYWLCQCECGEQRIVQRSGLHNGTTTSCGCYMRESKTSHGLCSHPSYGRYLCMVRRCTEPSHEDYPGYGGRGIKVWHTWLEKEDDKGLKRYLWYLDNVLGSCPGPEYTIDRINNDDDYRPWNLRWADKSEQAGNRRRSKNAKLTRDDALMIKFGNLPGTLKELADQFGVNLTAIGKIRRGESWSDLTQADYDALVAEDQSSAHAH